jgi:hypothetical protein
LGASWKIKKGTNKDEKENWKNVMEEYIIHFRKTVHDDWKGWQNISNGGSLLSLVWEPKLLTVT